MIELVSGERIYLVKRAHRIYLFTSVFPFFVVVLLTVFLIFYFLFFQPNWPQFLSSFAPGLLKLNFKLLCLFLLSQFLTFLFFLVSLLFLHYYFRFFIVTNQRIIFAELKSLFNMQISSLSLDKIQDITTNVKGFLAAFFGFGEITIQTAGAKGQFTFYQIPEPEIVKKIIFEAQQDFLKTKS